jgi:hypothetical protein
MYDWLSNNNNRALAREAVSALPRLLDTLDSVSFAWREDMARRKKLEEQLTQIHAALGCEKEWSHLHDFGACVDKNVSEMVSELRHLRVVCAALVSE